MKRRRDDTDYEQRTLANLTATIALLLTALALAATVRAFHQREALERCLSSGRRDCPGAPAAQLSWARRVEIGLRR